MPSPEDRHRSRLAAWREAHPGSPHPGYGLAELEALKQENDAKAARDLALRPEVCESSPSFLTIGNTHKCNLTCNMCFKQLDHVENMSLPDLGLSKFEAIAHEFFPHLRSVALSVSGDPLLSKTLFDELDLLATYGVGAIVTTNGMPLGRKGLYDRLLPALSTLVISMDGASTPVFDSIRRGASFAKVVENVRRFNEARDALPDDVPRPDLHFNTILQKKNVLELPALVELAHELSVSHVKVDHVLIHPGLNEVDSLEPHEALANEMIERARETAERLGVDVRLPAPFQLAEGHRDAEYLSETEESLLAHAHEKLETVAFDPVEHRDWFGSSERAALDELAKRASNEDLVEELLERGVLEGHLLWGIPQVGPSLIPTSREKVSACTYAWRETFIEWDGLVQPCCNPAMGLGRIMGRYEPGRAFSEIWNGPAYRNLRKSLASGKNYRFCRTCYLFEDPNEADWGITETWMKIGAELHGEASVVAGQVPPGKRAVLCELRSELVPEGSRVEVFADEELLFALDATQQNGDFRFTRALEDRPVLEGGQTVHVRCRGAEHASVELVAYVE